MALLSRIFGTDRAKAVQTPAGAPTSCDPVLRDDSRYFFVSGHPRSGTNWISNILNLHPLVYCKGEYHFHDLRGAFDYFSRHPWHVAHREPVRSVAERCFESTVRACLAAIRAEKPGARVLGDHTPRPLRVLLPDARYIVAVRDGRDVLVSWTFHLLRTGRPEVIPERLRRVFSAQLEYVGGDTDRLRSAARTLLSDEVWVRHYSSTWAAHVSRDADLIATVQSGESAADIHVVRYESLHGATHEHAGELFRFLGVDPALAQPLSVETRTLPGFGRDDPASFYRRGEVGDWRNHFGPDTANWFQDAAGPALNALGYDESPRVVVQDQARSLQALSRA